MVFSEEFLNFECSIFEAVGGDLMNFAVHFVFLDAEIEPFVLLCELVDLGGLAFNFALGLGELDLELDDELLSVRNVVGIFLLSRCS